MSSPPPPTYAQAPTPLSPEPATPRLSEAARIINTFIAPRKTFEDISINASWWVPWLLAGIFTILFGVVAVQKLDIPRLVQQGIEQNKGAQTRMEQASPEQREAIMRFQVVFTKALFFGFPVLALLGGLLIGFIFWMVFNFGFAAEVPFSKALAVIFYSFLPRIVPSILLSIILLTSADPNGLDFVHGNPIATNPGFFMDPASNKFLYVLLSGIDIFAIWPVILIGLGFSVLSDRRRVSPTAGIAAVFVAYVLLLVIWGGARAAFS